MKCRKLLNAPGPGQDFAGGFSQDPLLVALRKLIRASQTEERFGAGVMINGYGVVARPHQTLDAESVDHPPQLGDQIAIRERFAREPGGMPPFDRHVGVFGTGRQAGR